MKKFLVLMSAAIVTAAILVLIDRGPRTDQPRLSKAPEVATSPPDTSGLALVKPGSCAPTQCRFSPVISPAFEMTSNGKQLIGIWNLARSSQTAIVMKNVSPDPVTISAVTLYTCLNDAVVPVASVPAECRFIKIAKTDFTGTGMNLKHGESISTTVEADAHGQVAKLQFDTTRGPIIMLVTVQ